MKYKIERVGNLCQIDLLNEDNSFKYNLICIPPPNINYILYPERAEFFYLENGDYKSFSASFSNIYKSDNAPISDYNDAKSYLSEVISFTSNKFPDSFSYSDKLAFVRDFERPRVINRTGYNLLAAFRSLNGEFALNEIDLICISKGDLFIYVCENPVLNFEGSPIDWNTLSWEANGKDSNLEAFIPFANDDYLGIQADIWANLNHSFSLRDFKNSSNIYQKITPGNIYAVFVDSLSSEELSGSFNFIK